MTTNAKQANGRIKCPMCGFDFDAVEGQSACKTCPMSGGCGMMKCPNCGYEITPTPRWVEKIFRKQRYGNIGDRMPPGGS